MLKTRADKIIWRNIHKWRMTLISPGSLMTTLIDYNSMCPISDISLHMLCSLYLSSVSQPPTPDVLFFATSTYRLCRSCCPPPSLSLSPAPFRSHSPHFFITLVTFFQCAAFTGCGCMKKLNNPVSSSFPPPVCRTCWHTGCKSFIFLCFTLYLPPNKRAAAHPRDTRI